MTKRDGPVRVDIGIFAHNEAEGIGRSLQSYGLQDVLVDPDYDIRIFVIANGCTDATASVSREIVAPLPPVFEIVDLPEGGKSRTWNTYVHRISRPDSDLLLFGDADIVIPERDMLRRFIDAMMSRPELVAMNNRPVKDTNYNPTGLTLSARLIAMGGDSIEDWRKAICGNLYAMRADVARTMHVPIGLPVEDGFIRALILTRQFTQREDLTLLDGDPTLFHVYDSVRSPFVLLRHQIRLVIGSAINLVIFRHLDALPVEERPRELERAASDPNWLPALLKRSLPVWPYGWVPGHFLIKRARNILSDRERRFKPRSLLVLVLGFGFDLVAYVAAQVLMARGVGSGYW